MRAFGRLFCVVVVAGLGLAVSALLLAPQVRAFFTAGATRAGDEVDLQDLATRSVVYARDGSVLATLHAEENRRPVPLDQVPPHVVRAVLDAEDERFFEHGAIDLRGLTRALVNNVGAGGIFEGGSTITQQLVKTALLSPRRDLSRKIQEAALAIRLEEQMSKEEILERYLNTVYFGNGVYGLEAAAEKYYGTTARELTLSQGVLLASLIRNPVGGDPFTEPEEAKNRRALVTDRMLELGHVSAEEAEAIKAEPLPTPPPERQPQGSDYFTEHVKQLLLGDERLGATAQERTRAVFKGGLAIHTTLDAAYQRTAEAKVAEIIPDTHGEFTAALVSIEPATGAVRAMVGGTGFDRSKFNLVTQGGRQTGSSFKVFTLIAALEAGNIPNDTILGTAPCVIPNPEAVDPIWEPKNVEGQGGGVLTLTEATVNSVNCAYARLIKILGPQKVVEVAKRMGVTSPLQPNLSLTLGTDDVTPLDMASGYATLAADGERHEPYFIDRVEGADGKLIFKNEAKVERAISAQHARTTNQILTQVVSRGTGTAAYIPAWAGGVAGKTGSTDKNTNAWFVGFTPELSTAVWMGSPTDYIEMSNVGGIRVYGGTYPAMVWGAYMRELVAGKAPQRFPLPDPITTRPPKMLLMQGERPPPPDPEPSLLPVIEAPFGASTTLPGTVDILRDLPATTLERPRATRPTRPPDTSYTIPTFPFPFDDDEDETPRTSRTSRPPRDRDTTIPED
ncbi:MAG: penicillin-binding protein [Actinomycetota bacterium]|nr:penicillin-binding protein [Actinomycetota bacterium]